MTRVREIELPALRNNDALGVLCALGTLRVLTERGVDPRLGWAHLGGPAMLTAPGLNSADDIAGALYEYANEMAGEHERSRSGKVTLADPAVFGPGCRTFLKDGTSTIDPYVSSVASMLTLRSAARQAVLDGEPTRAEWTSALLGLPNNGDVAAFNETYKKYTGPTGLVSSLHKRLVDVVQQPELVRDALVRWRRVDGTYGDNLDHRAIADSGQRADGGTRNSAVPAATWLALLSLPLFPIVGPPSRTTGWHRRERSLGLVWPVWRAPLNLHAVAALLRHPAVARPADEPCRALGLLGVMRAERVRVGRAVPIGAAEVVWAP